MKTMLDNMNENGAGIPVYEKYKGREAYGSKNWEITPKEKIGLYIVTAVAMIMILVALIVCFLPLDLEFKVFFGIITVLIFLVLILTFVFAVVLRHHKEDPIEMHYYDVDYEMNHITGNGYDNSREISKEQYDVYKALDQAKRNKPMIGKIDSIVRAKFGYNVELIECHGPVQMCVFNLVYIYKPLNYKIIMDCERSILAAFVINEEGKRFWPGMIYPEENYCHDYSKTSEVERLVDATYRALTSGEIVFK